MRFELVGRRRSRGGARRPSLLVTGLLVLCAAGRGAAQEPSPQPSPSPSATPAPLRPPAVSGYVQFDERVGDNKGRNEPEHEFNVRRARLTLSGKVGERVGYNITFQGDGANANTASLLEGYADITVRPWLKVRAGQYKYEFDMEGRESDSTTPLPDRSFATTAVAGGLSGASTASSPAGSFRDRGLTLGGTTERGQLKWSYAVGFFQGTGRASDNNSRPAYLLGTTVEPRPGLKLNLGFLSTDNAAPGAAERSTYRAWTVGGAYDRQRLFFRGEYYRGRREKGDTGQELNGFYLIAAYTAAPRLDLVARYHAFEDERFAVGDDHMDAVDLGVKYYFDRRDRRSGTYVSAAYSIRKADAGVTSGLSLLNDGRGAALENGGLVGNVFTVRLQVRF